MFFIPGFLISAVTFPGVVVHEIAHRLFCHLTGVPVYEVRYYKFMGNPDGYVMHGPPPTLRAAFLISFGPLIVNSILCSLITFAAVIPVFILQDRNSSILSPILLWIGVSIGMHAFPSNHDARQFVAQVRRQRGRGLLSIVAQGLAGALVVVNALRVIWIDLIYAILLALLLPAAFGLF